MSKALVVVSNVGRIRPDVALRIAVDLLAQAEDGPYCTCGAEIDPREPISECVWCEDQRACDRSGAHRGW